MSPGTRAPALIWRKELLAGVPQNYTQIKGRFRMNVDRAVLAFAGGLLLFAGVQVSE
jgi:hypothetical protein